MSDRLDEVRAMIADAEKLLDAESCKEAVKGFLEAAKLAEGERDRSVLMLRARALRSAGAAAHQAGDLSGASQHLLAAQAESESARDGTGLAQTKLLLGRVRRDQGEPGEALELAEHARTAFVRMADREGEASALVDTAWASIQLGDHEAALRAADAAKEILRSRGRSAQLAASHRAAGDALVMADRDIEAVARYRDALEIAEVVADHLTGWASATGLARIAMRRGDREAAQNEVRAGLVHARPPIAPDDGGIMRILDGLVLDDESSGSPETQSQDSDPGEVASSVAEDELLDLGVIALRGPSARIVRARNSPGIQFELDDVRLEISLFVTGFGTANWSVARTERFEQLGSRGGDRVATVRGPHGQEVLIDYRTPVEEGGRSWRFGRFIGRDGPGWMLLGEVSITADAVITPAEDAGGSTQGELFDRILTAPDVARADAIFRSVRVQQIPAGASPYLPIVLR